MIYAIGDIHGCLKTLDALLAKLPYTPSDTLVFLGDYIDRGPDACGVMERLVRLLDEHEHLVFLRGNHEQMCLDALKAGENSEAYKLWLDPLNNGQATLDSYRGDFDPVHILVMRGMPLYYETDEYFFCHAGIDAGFPLYKQPKDALLWMREPFIHSTVDYGKTIVFGHTVMEKPLVTPNKIGIDTGCVAGRKLTAIALPSLQVYDAPCVDL